jgi:hypothetical protein
MVRVLKIFLGFSLLLGAQAFAAPPSAKLDQALCTRSATLLACIDAHDNRYSVAMSGTTMYLRGYESTDKRHWAQTNSRYGSMTFFTGLASDGELGWDMSRKWAGQPSAASPAPAAAGARSRAAG